VTVGFLYLILFLGGVTVALVTGLVRRALQPERFGCWVAPAHHHWKLEASPKLDFAVALTTCFGLVAFLVHGLAALDMSHEVGMGALGGLAGASALCLLMRRRSEHPGYPAEQAATATVVREIPAGGYGQVQVLVEGARVTLAARSEAAAPIAVGSEVEVVDRRESVVVVRPRAGERP
jgi:membrane protein implicated in regulation of membrane protease activity